MDAFKRALWIAGGRAQLARMIGISRQMVYQIESGRRPLPALLCRRIEARTGIKREELRPDVFGPITTAEMQE